MIKAEILGHFVFWAALLSLALELFAWILKRIVRLHSVIRLFIGISAYTSIIAIFTSPLFAFDLYVKAFGSMSDVEIHIFLTSHILSMLIAIIIFRKRNLSVLMSIGYYRNSWLKPRKK